ncbi:hypothetical protein [Streptomyces sp. NPDC096032]|uniref:hypothetical protein n=1 Tax=Streptomyces sp. NPDC096032 TaxID=3366070 RepID=UPI00381BB5C3
MLGLVQAHRGAWLDTVQVLQGGLGAVNDAAVPGRMDLQIVRLPLVKKRPAGPRPLTAPGRMPLQLQQLAYRQPQLGMGDS